MNNSALKQILTEYNLKRNRAIAIANQKKQDLLKINPRLAEIENEISKISIEASKAIVKADKEQKIKVLADLKKRSDNLIKEKKQFLKELSKTSDFLEPNFECKQCNDTGFIQKKRKISYV